MSTEEEQSDTTEAAEDSRGAQRVSRKRFAPLLLIAGLLATLAPLAPHLPREHQIDFRIEEDLASVERLDVSWTRLDGSSAGETVAGQSLRFERGRAPEIVNVHVNLPSGSYVLDIELQRATQSDSMKRNVTLGDAERIAIPLRLERTRP